MADGVLERDIKIDGLKLVLDNWMPFGAAK